MPYCPECGGEMLYIASVRQYVCQSCGLSLTQQELFELKERIKSSTGSNETEKEKIKKEYLKWWLSKKK